MLRRRCCRCGYHGSELQRAWIEDVVVCPSCGHDLYANPPRSYAELEGFHPGSAVREPAHGVTKLATSAAPSSWRAGVVGLIAGGFLAAVVVFAVVLWVLIEAG